MRKIVLSVVASCALIAVVPASALAHGGHGRHHHAHHARVHHRSFGGGDQGQGGTGQTQSQDAGTVQSFTGGVLTIALNNGQTVSGQVTGDTEIACESTDTSNSSLRSHDSGGDNNSGGDDGGGNQGDDDQGQGDDDNANSACSSSDLTAGTVVHRAELGVSGAGAVWDRVVLVTQSSQSTGSSGSSQSSGWSDS
ncbi:MAG: hypothetical protein JO027_08330 [Solirubrobacterales bacterium]|nr:hypothetical protein [Solirubrobacterales bacterium]